MRLEWQLGGRQTNRPENKANLEFLAIQGFKGVSPTYLSIFLLLLIYFEKNEGCSHSAADVFISNIVQNFPIY